ncbi:capsular polysaccharide transport system permease protein [Enhydrobacter aerosaccus]|uniref:Capsular polysaccharide transport system permease protein n=1 Tax=Enhydrobacter aerosaccus TaxID=225324 RepID=A0A1T4T751_9HYPH|nr:hypothetical protein [Enhydrobacter aerosaccus]SKA36257.1 capsular polysaccharide transport system permease protein [Enhydrobacter aerosaccus]
MLASLDRLVRSSYLNERVPFRVNVVARRLIKLALVFLPTILGIVYFGAIATNQYVSEARFIIRSAERPEAATGFAAILQDGLGHSQDDTYAVAEFIKSRDAAKQLSSSLPMFEIYGRPEADALARYPSIFFGRTDEEFYDYLRRMISVVYTPSTGVTTLTVRAFRPQDAKEVAAQLLALSEKLINRMNNRMQEDLIATSTAEVAHSQEQLIMAQIAISRFRNAELMIDPTKSATSLTELISKLSVDLAQAKAQMREVLAASPNSVQYFNLQRRIAALEEQIGYERARITTASDGLAEKIAEFERLNLNREFANRALTNAETALTRARADARRQQLYLETIVQPSATDYPLEPKRASVILTIFGANMILFLVAWLIYTGVREHAVGA